MGGSRKKASVKAEGEGTRGEWGGDLPPSSTSLHGQEQNASVEAGRKAPGVSKGMGRAEEVQPEYKPRIEHLQDGIATKCKIII